MERIAIVFDIEAGALPKQVEHEELSRRALATLANHINPIVHHRQRQAVTTQRLLGAEQSDKLRLGGRCRFIDRKTERFFRFRISRIRYGRRRKLQKRRNA